LTVHADGTDELMLAGRPDAFRRKLNILGTAPYPGRVTEPSVRRRSGVIPVHWRRAAPPLVVDLI
jgi:hypothetical protein